MSEYDYTQRELKHAKVYTWTHPPNPDLKVYEVHSTREFAELMLDMRDPVHCEWVYDVDATYCD